MVRAETHVGDGSARGGELRLHPFRELEEVRLGVEPPADAGLVRDDDEQKPRLMEAAGGLAHAGHPLEVLLVMDVVVIDVDHAVAVEKCGSLHARLLIAEWIGRVRGGLVVRRRSGIP